jgi:outer membrane protein insertion porin family
VRLHVARFALVQFSALVLLSTLVLAGPRRIASISFSGNSAIRSSDLEALIASEPDAEFSPSVWGHDLRTIHDAYVATGYYFVAVRPSPPRFNSDSSSVELSVTIVEGSRALIGVIALEGNTVFPVEEILNSFDTKPGTILVQLILEADIDRLIKRYDGLGYPFTSVSVEDVVPYDTAGKTLLNVHLSIEEGQRIKIGEIGVRGNKDTRTDVIVRESGLRVGEFYSGDEIDRVRGRLNRLGVFSSVDEPQLYLTNEDVGGVQLGVKEGNTNSFDGIVGYVPAGTTPNSSAYLTGLVDISMRNLFGSARKLTLNWQRDDQYTQEVAVKYLEPWVLNFPLNATLSFDQRQQDSSYVQRTFGAKGEFRVTDYFSASALLDDQSVIPSSTLVQQVVTSSQTLTTGFEIKFDSRDDILSPTSGLLYSSDYEFGRKKVYISSQPAPTPVEKLTVDAEVYEEFITHQVLAIGLHGRQLTNSDIEEGDLFRFGGATTLRGYAENQFAGSRVAWTNFEYRLLTARQSFLFGFFDSGYYYVPASTEAAIPAQQFTKYGYGVGIRFQSGLGNMNVSFALGEGDSFSQAKIHVGLVGDF